MVVNSYQVNKLAIKADLFSFKFQKFLLRMPNFLLGIYIYIFPSPVQMIWKALLLSKLSLPSPSPTSRIVE